MAEVKGVRKRRTELLNDWKRNRRRFWELKEEAEDRKVIKHILSQDHKAEIQR